jgi:hypothetical protein
MRQIIPWLVACFVFAVVCFAIYSVEIKNRDSARSAGFRFCSRDNVHRAQDQSEARSAQERRFLMVQEPILWCEPNLAGHGARPRLPSEQREFVRRWLAGETMNLEEGICPRSSPGEGDQTGKC